MSSTVATAVDLVKAPLIYKGKVRELYDLGEHYLIVVTDRISAFDYVLEPPIPGKGEVLNLLSRYWFDRTSEIISNHVVHTDVERLGGLVSDPEKLRNRVMVTKKAERIDMECIVRGYITGGGWRQYEKTGEVNGIRLEPNLRKNQQLSEPLFTPSVKNDNGHDEDIPVARMKELVGAELTEQLQQASLALYRYAADYCEKRGIILADCKFEFGYDGHELILIDEIFTPDSSRFWSRDKYALDTEIDSMDKEPVRYYLATSGWDKESPPPRLSDQVVNETSARYRAILDKLIYS